MASVKAEPYEFEFETRTTALVMIDFQRDFVDPGGFGEALGNDVALLRRAVPAAEQVLKVARAAGLFIVHTREGHRSDLADCPPAKKARGRLKIGIGDPGPMGRILVRGEAGHDIVKELAPAPGEPVVDKPGKGAFYATDLHATPRESRTSRSSSCAASRPRCASTPPCARRTTGATTAWSSRTAWPRTSRAPPGRAGDGEGSGRDLRLGLRLPPLPRGARPRALTQSPRMASRGGDHRARARLGPAFSPFGGRAASRVEFFRRVAEHLGRLLLQLRKLLVHVFPDGASIAPRRETADDREK